MTRLVFLLACLALLWPLDRAVLGETASSQTAVRLKIMEVNDLHISTEKDTEYPAKVIEAMNREGAQLALVVGDIANSGKEDELRCAKGVLDKFTMPYYIVRGNHDGTKELFQQVFNKDRAPDHVAARGIHIVFLDPDDKTTWDKKVAEPEAQDRLKKAIAAAPTGEPFVLCCHYPLGEGVPSRLKNSQEILDCFKDKKLLAAIGGHFHGNTEVTSNGILFTTTACASSFRANHNKTTAKGYRIFTITEDMKITTEFREVPEEKR
ncbi:MAG: metallophosphoesterase [Candidatus Sumerlaeota bacterium]|nr:metallophosphoesterase [Candidatus Sumerlaeota bacterium]